MRHETRDALGMALVAAIGLSPIWIPFLAFLFSGRFW
jgi:hypothetical protein